MCLPLKADTYKRTRKTATAPSYPGKRVDAKLQFGMYSFVSADKAREPTNEHLKQRPHHHQATTTDVCYVSLAVLYLVSLVARVSSRPPRHNVGHHHQYNLDTP